MTLKFWQIFFVILLSSLILSGCGTFTNAEQLDISETIYVDASNPVGQTCYASFDGLNGIVVYLEPPKDLKGNVTLHVRNTPQDELDIASASLPNEVFNGPGYFRFPFSSLASSTLKEYYFFLTVDELDTMVVKAGPGGGYVNGAAYRNHQPIDQQLAFQMSYDIPQAIGGLLKEGLSWIYYLLVAVWLYVLPAWVLLPLVLPKVTIQNGFSRAALSAGVSLAIYPILFLFTHMVGLQAGALYAWGPSGAATIYLIYRLWAKRKTIFPLKNRFPKLELPDITLLFVAALIIFSRFWVIRTVNAPFWGDSYQHTMIVQLLIDQKGLFSSWLPYAELHSFTYHFGFHAASVIFHWATGLSATQSVLWVGQIINILAVLAIYPLAVRLTGQRWAAVAAVLFAGLLSNYPMYYVNWGRYPQLAGQVILPAVILMIFELFENPKSTRTTAIGTGIAIAGLGMTHYRILILIGLFLAARAIFLIGSSNRWRHLIDRIFVMGLSAGLCFLPWLINVYGGVLLNRTLTAVSSTVNGSGQATVSAVDAVGLQAYYPPFVWILLILACLVAFWKHSQEFGSFILWFFFSLVLVNNHWLGLSLNENIGNFTLLIMAYLWIGPLFGAGIVWILQLLRLDRQRWFEYVLVMPFLFVALFGFKERITVLNPLKHSLLTRPDEKAMAWIADNLPEDAVFLVNSFFAFNDGVIVGSDGGWWLPIIAHRENTVPPILYDIEKGPMNDYRVWINQLTRQINNYGITSPDVLKTFDDREITYIYIGQQQGKVNSQTAMLNLIELQQSKYFRLVYRQDRIWIFEIVQ